MSHDPQHGFYNHQADALMRRLEAMVFQAMQDRLFSFYVVSPLMGHGFPGTGNYYMFVFRFPIFVGQIQFRLIIMIPVHPLRPQ